MKIANKKVTAEMLVRDALEKAKHFADYNIFTFINENIDNQQLSITMVTDYFHISAPTLQKRIYFRMGKTFSSYVIDMRMQKAQQMLHNTSLSVQEIAQAVGYSNANSFYKAYKRHYGEAPTSTKQNNGGLS